MFKTKSYYSSLKGKRESNEDAHCIMNNRVNYFWGVFDGHGGKDVSEYLGKHMAPSFLRTIHKDGYKIPEIRNNFENIQKQLIVDSKKENFNINDVGSTCLVALLTGNKLQVANVGDCRAVLCQDKGLARALTIDHKPDWSLEKNRIEKLGGKVELDKDDDVYRIMDLSVSRAFGDLEYSAYVKNHPDVFTYRLKTTDQFLILACDGLWDEVSSQDAVNFVLKNKDKVPNIALSLGKWAINEKESTDNVSIIVIFFNKREQSNVSKLHPRRVEAKKILPTKPKIKKSTKRRKKSMIKKNFNVPNVPNVPNVVTESGKNPKSSIIKRKSLNRKKKKV